MEIRFGQEVESQDGQRVGAVASALVVGDTREVSHVIVQAHGQHYLVPLSLVQGNAAQRLVLHARADQLEQLPHTHPGGQATGETTVASAAGEQFLAPEPAERAQRLRQALGVETELVELSEATVVEAQGEAIGHLVGVAGDVYTDRLQFLQIRLDASARLASISLQGLEDLRADRVRFGITLDEAIRLASPPSGGYIHGETHRSDLQPRG